MVKDAIHCANQGAVRHHFMKRLFFTVVIFCLFITNTAFAGNWQAPIVMDGATPVTAEELSDLIKGMDNLVLIDTRQHIDAGEARIEGSVILPYTQTSPDALARLVPDKLTPVVFYCEGLSCPHSMKAIRKAVSYGYVNIFWFRGGMSEWQEKGFPVVNNQ